jgi:hypothetical protein
MLVVGLVSVVLILEASLLVGLVFAARKVGEYSLPVDSEKVGGTDLMGGRSATFALDRLGHGGDGFPNFPSFPVVGEGGTAM